MPISAKQKHINKKELLKAAETGNVGSMRSALAEFLDDTTWLYEMFQTAALNEASNEALGYIAQNILEKDPIIYKEVTLAGNIKAWRMLNHDLTIAVTFFLIESTKRNLIHTLPDCLKANFRDTQPPLVCYASCLLNIAFHNPENTSLTTEIWGVIEDHPGYFGWDNSVARSGRTIIAHQLFRSKAITASAYYRYFQATP